MRHPLLHLILVAAATTAVSLLSYTTTINNTTASYICYRFLFLRHPLLVCSPLLFSLHLSTLPLPAIFVCVYSLGSTLIFFSAFVAFCLLIHRLRRENLWHNTIVFFRPAANFRESPMAPGRAPPRPAVGRPPGEHCSGGCPPGSHARARSVATAVRSRSRQKVVNFAGRPGARPRPAVPERTVKSRSAHSGPKTFLQKRQNKTVQRPRKKQNATRTHEIILPKNPPTSYEAPAQGIMRSVEHGSGRQEQLTFSGWAALLLSIVHPSRERTNKLELRAGSRLQGGASVTHKHSLGWPVRSDITYVTSFYKTRYVPYIPVYARNTNETFYNRWSSSDAVTTGAKALPRSNVQQGTSLLDLREAGAADFRRGLARIDQARAAGAGFH